MKIYFAAITSTLTDGEYQMSEIQAAKYGDEFNGDTEAYIKQNCDLSDDMSISINDIMGDIHQNYGACENIKNICVIRKSDGTPIEVWWAAE